MNKTPSILVNTGFPVDQNGALTELDFPNVVTTLKAPEMIVFGGTTVNWIPSTTAILQRFEAPYCDTIPTNCFKGYAYLNTVTLGRVTALSNTASAGGAFYGCTGLTTISLPSLAAITDNIPQNSTGGAFYGCTGLTSLSLPALASIACTTTASSGGAFYGCTGLTSLSLPALVSITNSVSNGNSSGGGAFYGCTGLTSLSLPALATLDGQNISNNNGSTGAFFNCTGLVTVSLPSLVTCNDATTNRATFGNCTSLESVQLGSEGHAVTSLGAYMFKNCTQSNLTITIYTADGNALANSPFGATNATIVYEEA